MVVLVVVVVLTLEQEALLNLVKEILVEHLTLTLGAVAAEVLVP
jgi:hypothetical protein